MKTNSQKASAVVFLSAIIIMMVMSLFCFGNKFSETENRTLTKMPKMEFSSLKDTTYMTEFESFLADHFIARTSWMKLRSSMELIIGKTDINDVYLTDTRLLEKLSQPDYTLIDSSAAAISSFSQKYPDLPVYLMLAPTASLIYSEELPDYCPQYNQNTLISHVYDAVGDDVTVLDVYNTLYGARDEYLYYRTDHHWTSLGAYYAYNYAITKLGFAPVPYSSYNIEHANNGFRGTLYNKTLHDAYLPDSIDIYDYAAGTDIVTVKINDGYSEKEYDSLYFREYLSTADKYSTFLGGNHPLVTITTNSQSGKKLLLIKDSYANSFVPFLTQHYSEITMVDMRYISVGLDIILDPNEYSQALILYNASGFSTDEDLRRIGR